MIGTKVEIALHLKKRGFQDKTPLISSEAYFEFGCICRFVYADDAFACDYVEVVIVSLPPMERAPVHTAVRCVHACIMHGIQESERIAELLGISVHLVREYRNHALNVDALLKFRLDEYEEDVLRSTIKTFTIG